MLNFLLKQRHLLLGLLIGTAAFINSMQVCFKKNQNGSIIYSDAEGYYLYLPSVFIYGNFEDYTVRTYGNQLKPEGKIKNKYTCGVAILQAPFFILADRFVSQSNKYERNGHSDPYVVSILFAGAFYLGLGIFMLSKLLATRVSFTVSSIALLCLFLGTNLFYYSAQRPGMSHVYSFFLFSAFVYSVHYFLKKPTIVCAGVMGLVLGLIIVVRPTNVMVGFIYFAYDITSWKDVKDRLFIFFNRPLLLLTLLVAMFLMFFPQMLYWHEVWGGWISYSYKGESFIYWKNPKLYDVLFDKMNGWLLYSPIALFALVGMPSLIKRDKFFGWTILGILCVATYSFASWWAWWFGGAFGHRCYVEFYALLAFPMAYAFQRILKKGFILRLSTGIIVALLCYYNLALSDLYAYTAPWDGPDWTWASYWDKVERIF